MHDFTEQNEPVNKAENWDRERQSDRKKRVKNMQKSRSTSRVKDLRMELIASGAKISARNF